LKAEEVLRIEGAYVKSWRGIPQISFDERATITRLKSDLLPPANVLNASPRIGSRTSRSAAVARTSPCGGS